MNSEWTRDVVFAVNSDDEDFSQRHTGLLDKETNDLGQYEKKSKATNYNQLKKIVNVMTFTGRTTAETYEQDVKSTGIFPL